MGMDLEGAIAGHMACKQRLEDYLARPDGSIAPEQVADPASCDLGAWLVEESARYTQHEDFERLMLVHRAFHTAAADMVRRVHGGLPVRADLLLGSGSLYARASSAVVHAVMRLRGRRLA